MKVIANNLWSDFTRENYKKLLKIAAAKYNIVTVSDWQNSKATGIWRHDVDCSPHRALDLAKIESDEGVVATYYFNMRSEFYNLFEPTTLSIVREIQLMGHEIGLHLDSTQCDVSAVSKLEESLFKEKYILESIFNIEIKSFSFHNPSEITNKYKDHSYAGLINAYSKGLMSNFKYCSDSGGYWRFTPLEKFLQQNHKNICVLSHPEWWPDQELSPRNRILRCIEGRAISTLHQYDGLLKKIGRENIES
jgi:hypothetical protein